MKAIRAAQRERIDAQSNVEAKRTQRFPLSVIEPYLCKEQVVSISNTCTNDIHNCMLLLFEKQRVDAPSRQNITGQEEVDFPVFFRTNGEVKYAKRETTRKCDLCGSHAYEEDSRQGFYVCKECGVISGKVCYNQSFAKEQTFGGREIDVASWAINSTISQEEWKRHVLTVNMEQWNKYVCLGEDDLKYAMNLVFGIQEKRKIKAKCLAALLYVRNKQNIDKWLTEQRGTIELPYKPPTFDSCKMCKHVFSSLKDKRFHYKICRVW